MILPMPKFIRRWLAILRGGVSPVIIFISTLLGFTFGLVPGFSGLHVAIIVLVLILNVHIGLFLMTFAAGKGLCFAAAPVLYHIGVGVHDYLAPLLRLLAAVPVIGITDLSRYAVAGGIVAGPIVGGLAGFLLALLVIQFRKQLLRLEENSERFRQWYSKTWVRILDRILIGRRTKDAKSLFTSKATILRKAGIVLAIIVLGLCVLLVTAIKDDKARDYAVAKLTWVNGAEVNLDALSLGILSGSASAKGIQVTDARQPANNQVAIDEISADASVYNLLLGRVVVDKMVVSNMQFNQPRPSPGQVVRPPDANEGRFDPCDYRVTVEDVAQIDKYLQNARKLKDWLAKVRKWLPEPRQAEKPAIIKYLDYLLARTDAPPAPRFMARDVLLDKVAIPALVLGNSTIQAANLNDSPAAARLPIRFDIKSNETPMQANLVLDYTSGEPVPKIRGSFSGVELSKLGVSDSAGIAFASGAASGSFAGTLTRDAIDISIDVDVNDMQASSVGDGVLGLGGEATTEALKVLKNLQTNIRIVGPTSDPRIVLDVKGLTDSFLKALPDAMRARAMEELDKALGDKLGDKLPAGVGDGIKDAVKDPNGILKGLGGLFEKK